MEHTFEFISDEKLRSRLEDATGFIYALYEQSNAEGQSDLYKEEANRVIVLYVVSTIEALLLYYFQQRGEKVEYVEYKHVHPLPEGYGFVAQAGHPAVIAVQKKVEKREHQLGLHDLVRHFKDAGKIRNETAQDILKLNEMRNTFHFSKPRTDTCDVRHVERALKLLVYTIKHAPRALSHTRKI